MDVRRIGDIRNTEFSLRVQLQIAGDDAGISGFDLHGADTADIVDNGAHGGIIRADICYDPHESAACQDIHVDPDAVRRPFVDAENVEPAAGVLGDDPGPGHSVLAVLLVQLIQTAQPVQLEAVRLQSGVLHDELIDLLLEFTFVLQGAFQLLMIPDAVVKGSAYPVDAGLHRHQQVADCRPEGRQPFIPQSSDADHHDADNAQDDQDQSVVRYFHSIPHSLKL